VRFKTIDALNPVKSAVIKMAIILKITAFKNKLFFTI
jgi:hypothetical protein